jgi:dodecin
MANRTYVVNEIVGTSTDDVNSAIRNGVKRAAQTLRHLDWFEVVEVRGAIMDGDVAHYQVTMKVGLRLEDAAEAEA